MIFIGDVHGKVDNYHYIVKNNERSICVGDFGFKWEWNWLQEQEDIKPEFHRINMGNHDYIPYVQSNHSCGNWSYTDEGIFTMRGADSIDKNKRLINHNWFEAEQLTYREGLEVIDKYETFKPEIVVTHDCPQEVMKHLFGYRDSSITRIILQEMFSIHQPLLWIFGHHHQSKNVNINGTNFRCLEELEVYNL